MSSLLGHGAVSEYQYFITVDHSGQSVGDDDGGPVLGGQLQGSHDRLLSDGVQTGGGLVKYQYRCVFQHGPAE